MLELLRKGAGTWVAKILFGVLVASFALWGVDDVFTGGGANILATAGDREVTAQEFDAAFRRELQQASQQSGETLTVDEGRAMGIDRQVLAQLATRKLIEEAYTDLGMTVSDQAVAEYIRGIEAFHDDFGKFDKFRFERIIGSVGYRTEESFIEAIRGDMTAEQLIDPLSAGVRVPESAAKAIFASRSEEREVRYVRLNPEDISVPAPSEADLQRTYKENEKRYMAPELRRLSYLDLTAKALAKDVNISDEDLQAAYEERIDEYTAPEQRSFNRLVAPDLATAEKIVARARAGESLVAIGNELLGFAEEDVKNDATARAALPTDQGDLVFGLPVDGVSDPAESGFGYIIVQLTGIYPGSVKSFDEVKPALAAELAENLALDHLYTLVEEIEDMHAGGSSLSEIATAKALTLQETEQTSISGRNIDGGPVNGLPADAIFLETAFTLDSGETSDMLETSNGDYLMVQVNEVTPPALRPFEDVKTLVTYHATLTAQIKAAEVAAKKLQSAAETAGSLEAAANAQGAKVEVADRVTRGSVGQTFPAQLLEQIFTAPKGNVILGTAQGAPMIVAVSDIRKVSASDEPGAYTFVRAQLSQAMGSDLSNLYQTALEDAYGVEIYPGAIDRLYTPQDEQ